MHTHTWFNMHISHENKSINILLLKSSADLPGSQQLLGRTLGHGRLGLASPGTQWLGSGAAMRMRCQLGVRGTTGAGDLTHFGVKNMRKTLELRCEKKPFGETFSILEIQKGRNFGPRSCGSLATTFRPVQGADLESSKFTEGLPWTIGPCLRLPYIGGEFPFLR